ncbi:hypothetical protein [Cystobacter ferrugineus]|uniref:Uncharacterized protein n=1 Tax=Cystobacter ferrugineus TaxID=83449 RepID=A0A1L9BGW2_9BACT|nr:hypothetical protein [Cystobacter ferrugineus]OJH41446.1 hypothetical protein BON30_11365 [Cystobacter ferrugineus]
MSMTKSEMIEQLEQRFGYPLPKTPEFVARLATTDEEEVEQKLEERLAYLLSDNIHWDGEFQEGPHPAVVARRLQFARLDMPEPNKPVDEQPVKLLARHLTGLFCWEHEYTLAPEGQWLVDLNPRRDGLTDTVYYEPDSGQKGPRWYIFESITQFANFEELRNELEMAEADEEEARQDELAEQLSANHPRGVALFSKSLKELGVKAKSRQQFSDPEAERLFEAYESFHFIAEVLVARARGKRGARLSAAAVERCAKLFANDPDYPPHSLMSMLVPALSADMEQARLRAAEVLRRSTSTGLSRRWAERIQKGLAPLGN